MRMSCTIIPHGYLGLGHRSRLRQRRSQPSGGHNPLRRNVQDWQRSAKQIRRTHMIRARSKDGTAWFSGTTHYLFHTVRAETITARTQGCWMGLRYPVEVGLVDDSRRMLQQTHPLLTEMRPLVFEVRLSMQQWWTLIEGQ